MLHEAPHMHSTISHYKGPTTSTNIVPGNAYPEEHPLWPIHVGVGQIISYLLGWRAHASWKRFDKKEQGSLWAITRPAGRAKRSSKSPGASRGSRLSTCHGAGRVRVESGHADPTRPDPT